MSFLTPAAAYPYRSGSLFLGLDPATNAPVGINTERHAITIAGARSGKGAALLIPNALRWPHNLLVIDPKGENAEASWQAREALGQKVAILDPFSRAPVPARLRASFNPLAAIDPQSSTARADIRVIADGLVKRHKQEDGEWYDGAVSMLAGLIAYVIETAPAEHRTFAAVRAMLTQPHAALNEDAQRMQATSAFGGLAKSSGVAIMTALEPERSMEKQFLGGARRSTEWMDEPEISKVLASSTFKLSDLKKGKLSLFLVLPPQYLDEYGTFLRLFVRCAINAMMDDGVKTKGECLFLLDEFYSLGRLDIVAKSAGLMGGYGLHLWPFLQDLGQLQGLYTKEGAETFFGNADAAVFFGNTDQLTLEYASRKLGNLTAPEVVAAPPQQGIPWASKDPFLNMLDRAAAVEHQNARAHYEHAMRQAGKPRLTPEQVAQVVGKKDGDKVARSALVFAKGGDVLNVRLQPYFIPTPPPPVARAAPARSMWKDDIIEFVKGAAVGVAVYVFCLIAFPDIKGSAAVFVGSLASVAWFARGMMG